MSTRSLLAGLAVTVVALGTACSGTTTTSASNAGTSPAACPPAGGTADRTTTFSSPPPMCIDPNKTYTAKIDTSAGSFTVALDAKRAPLAVNNFVFLARHHFYDGVAFHRIIPDFVIQGGDANGKPPGTGDPGYEFSDELPTDPNLYQPGTLAMANSGPDTNGSQFFVVLAPGRLQAKYSLFGQVTEGFDTTIEAIAKTGTDSGKPTSPTTISSVTITET